MLVKDICSTCIRSICLIGSARERGEKQKIVERVVSFHAAVLYGYHLLSTVPMSTVIGMDVYDTTGASSLSETDKSMKTKV